MRRLAIAAAAALALAVAVVPVARALRADHGPSLSAPEAADVGERTAELTAVVDTARLGGRLGVAYGRTSILTTKVALRTIAHGTAPGRTGGVVRGLTPGTTYHYRFSLTTEAGTITTPDATFTTARAAARCRVPALKGDALATARRALRRAGCRTGHVRRPARVAHGARLVVGWQSVAPGRVRAAGTRVALRLRAAR